jgi:hypothetical protein
MGMGSGRHASSQQFTPTQLAEANLTPITMTVRSIFMSIVIRLIRASG